MPRWKQGLAHSGQTLCQYQGTCHQPLVTCPDTLHSSHAFHSLIFPRGIFSCCFWASGAQLWADSGAECPGAAPNAQQCLQQGHSLCLENVPPEPPAYGGEEGMRRGEEVIEEGERGGGKEKNRVKTRKEGERTKGGRERQKGEGRREKEKGVKGGEGKRGKRGKGRSQPAGRQHFQHQPLDCGTQRCEKCRDEPRGSHHSGSCWCQSSGCRMPGSHCDKRAGLPH